MPTTLQWCIRNKITYSELDKRSDVLARKLHAMGIVRSNIGIALPKTIDMMVAILATLKSGNTYVPIDIHHPKDRIAFIVNDASLRLVLGKHVTFLAIYRVLTQVFLTSVQTTN